MDWWDFLGRGLCHMDPARTAADAWLCHRCTGLYGGGLVGVVFSRWFGRSNGLLAQILICAALVVPMAVDGAFLGRGSSLDPWWWRLMTGTLGGLGSGLFLGARGVEHIDFPNPLTRGTGWLWGAGLAASVAAVFLLGRYAALSGAVLAGLFAMCLAASAWGLQLGRIGLRRLGVSSLDFRPFHVGPLVLLVVAELVVVALVPARFKPTVSMAKEFLGWLGLPFGS